MKKVVIDPGHGGPDPGAVGPTGAQEKNVVLPVAKKLADILQSAGAEVKLTRENDSVPWTDDTDLSERVRIANEFGADVFISIHANAYSSPAAKGLEVWTTKGQTGADPIAESIADALIAAFPDLVFRSDLSDGDKDKESNFYVLYYTDAPAVLVELGFITNPTEEELLNSPDYQARAARAIAEGLAEYLGLTLPALVAPDATTEAIGVLQAAGVIASPDYWLQNARPGKQADGQYVGLLIQNMAKKLRG
ncbi:MAG TPA: N-acetylmuramoyl-L-alanine amidase [Bacillota bacterium]|nr:N-acetylmuramoyl-L-alanine amidase [Bacillota bacterium]